MVQCQIVSDCVIGFRRVLRVRLDRILGHARDLEGEGGGRGSRSRRVQKVD